MPPIDQPNTLGTQRERLLTRLDELAVSPVGYMGRDAHVLIVLALLHLADAVTASNLEPPIG